MAGMGRRTYLRDVNPYLICPLCRGYLVDATTVVECLHSFCRSCILKHLKSEAHCPTCNHVLNNAKPDIKADKALQDIVYKLVPGLYHKEMRRRREFYKKNPEYAESATPEQKGEDVSGRLIFAPEDAVSLSLEYLPPGADPLSLGLSISNMESIQRNLNNNNNSANTNRRYLQCPALVTIAHLKKFLALKYSVDLTRYTIEICHRTAPLPEHWTLMDVAYMYAWKRNAPMRFFYRIAQEEPRLEAPPHDRPSTPGLGASLPPADSTSVDTNEIKAEKEKREVNDNQELPQVKSPIKILKNSEGRYEVLKPALKTPPLREPEPQIVKTVEQKETNLNPEFSVVSIGDGQNSNGVKITLKQCSPSTLDSKKPKVISNVLVRRSPIKNDVRKSPPMEQVQKTKNATKTPGFVQVEKGKDKEREKVKEDKKQKGTEMESEREKEKIKGSETSEKQDQKQKRKVTFVDTLPMPVKLNGEVTTGVKKPGDLPDKKQFLQSFQLTARESKTETPAPLTPRQDSKALPPKIDVYTFPSDPPTSITHPLPPGAVKRKCPPGLPIFEAKRRKLQFTSQPKKLTVKPLNRIKPNQQTSSNSANPTGNTFSAPMAPPSTAGTGNAKSSPNLHNNTRNLLDGCGLNIPASLSITLTAPKSPNNSSAGDHSGHSKDNLNNLLNKVNPSITLNDRSVDPRVLKALKTGQIRMPAPSKIKPKNTDKEAKISPKRKKDQDPLGEDALDLSGVKKMEIHPLRIPQPVSKAKNKSATPVTRENNAAQGQVVTLVGGQRYYRAPPGSLTPAAHRVTDIPIPVSTSRAPVYAPSCLPSPTSSGGRSSLSSVFPSLQSLYALSQAQNRQQLQIEARLRLPQTDANTSNSPSKSHLAAQCAPVKPARSSVASLAVPIMKQPNNGTMPCEGTLR
ncbi:polycomb group protein Psc-like [Athalia rosae]|uniref:polycomb group protein Psc-like n=1 Tax=Athalia rosae TaxID=37344 RepID=UPI002033A6F7|nr:polycomb group protein Psc-like [Athalia rosae]XP_048514685.1 polycomb group protein Psc-like [Athalia rosae]XP_048514686.1 polycomb group protein Psc-like [Athalia rosae]XP_048514687.1 polycomb group protein Psc-like [Athalia rosae]XP_048514688.1 polycomb group protein Psc-like [Athalia rosae]XP_048514689.1 polycomb group protein Psc-like [Athalia rosae]XP_048514690.1 polycomb group protein Psc-like [Athalia rosae]XP_048514691.1 polycomb group protein Psc-like [Athalia rosae]XP_04851469